MTVIKEKMTLLGLLFLRVDNNIKQKTMKERKEDQKRVLDISFFSKGGIRSLSFVGYISIHVSGHLEQRGY